MDERIIFIQTDLQSDLKRQWSIEDLADKVKLSAAHLRKLFKSETGICPIQYLQNLRLEKARELLINSFDSIKQIAFTVGIRDQSNFNRYFKAKYGMPPLIYRRKYRKFQG